MARQTLGKVMMLLKSEYDSNTQYEILDVVTYNGSSYVAKQSTQGNLPTNTNYWLLLAEKGDAATINGYNVLSILEGINTSIQQSGNQLTINNTYEYDDTDVKRDIQANANDISQNSTDIEALQQSLSNYSLITETGSKLNLVLNNTTYQLYMQLLDKNNNVINTSSTIDLPIESLILNVTYDNSSKELVITLENGTTRKVPVGDLISGLQSEITSTNKLSSDLVDDTNNTNKFATAAEKEKLAGIEQNANNYSLPTATESVLGGIKVGNTLSIDDGVLDVNVSDRIENAIKNFFAMTPDYKEYTVRFPLWDTSNTCAGEKLNDNIGLSLTPATDTVREINNYGMAFDSIDCNAYVDSSGVRHITAIKGMEEFADVGEVDVFCLFRTYWQKIWEEDGYLYVSRVFYPKDGYTINPLAINKDGTYNPWFLIAKYVAGKIDGKLYSSKGLIPAHLINNVPSGSDFSSTNVCYNGMITLGRARGNYYSAGLMAEYMHILTTFWIKFATKNTQSILAGNTNNNYQYVVSQTEENVSRVILTTEQAANIDINTCVSVGDRGSATDNNRNFGYMHNLAYNVKVIGKEVIDESNTALIIDHDPITTTATTYVSTMHEISGYSDSILGRTGSIGSNTNGKHGFVFDGIEVAVGGYEVAGNAFMDIVDSTGKREIYFTNDVTKLTSTVATAKTTYTKSDLSIQPASKNGWKYITEYGFDTTNGLAVPTKAGQSGSGTSVGYADGLYVDNGSSGQREFLWLGSLYIEGYAGFACLNANSVLSYTYWPFLARLSINGVGGELTD